MSVSEAKAKITATEFVCWQEFFQQEFQTAEKQEFYLARICYMLYLIPFMFGGNPDKKFSDFMINWEQILKEAKEDQRNKKQAESSLGDMDEAVSLADWPPKADPEEVDFEKLQEHEKQLLYSKAAWVGALGIGADGKIKTRKPPIKPKKKKR